MATYQKVFRLLTKGHCHVINIDGEVQSVVEESGIGIGIVNVSGRGSTLGITTLEYEPGCVSDLERALDEIAPPNSNYAHNARWGDNNGYSHLRSALIGTAKSYPLVDGQLSTGTWQQIVLCDFDDCERDREVTVTVIGD
jgi:secondary thiamine-phosphate synthase enzyme